MDLGLSHSLVTSLVFTIAIETCVVFALLKGVLKDRRIDPLFLLAICFFASFTTIPYVWLVIPGLLGWSRTAALIVTEPFAFIVEAIFYRITLGIDMKKALLISLVANAASYFLGPLLRGAGLWLYW